MTTIKITDEFLIGLGVLIFVFIVGFVVGYNVSIYFNKCSQEENITETLSCQIATAKFYYHPQCGWCQKQITEGNLKLLEDYGVNLEWIDVTTGNYSFVEGTPAWTINDQLLYGYMTKEQLLETFRCS